MKRFCAIFSCFFIFTAMSCSDDPDVVRDPIPVGMLTFGAIAPQHELVVSAAINSINARGGVLGYPLELHVEDTDGSPPSGVAAFNRLVEKNVVGIIGPTTSGQAGELWQLARDQGIPLISGSSTDPTLVDKEDGGFLIRNISNDAAQAQAIAKYLTDTADLYPAPIVVVHDDSGYGKGIKVGLQDTLAGAVFISFTANLNSPETENPTDVEQLVTDVVAEAPGTVVLVGLDDDLLAITNVATEREELTAAETKPAWFFTDGARGNTFPGSVSELLLGSQGTAAFETSFSSAVDAYESLYDDYHVSPDSTPQDTLGFIYSTNVWDAAFLLAGGIAAQLAGGTAYEDLGGSGLVDGIFSAAQEGIPWHAGDWNDMIENVRDGKDVDYAGRSGPNDFDNCGEVTGSYEVWELTAERSFEQLRVYSPEALASTSLCNR